MILAFLLLERLKMVTVGKIFNNVIDVGMDIDKDRPAGFYKRKNEFTITINLCDNNNMRTMLLLGMRDYGNNMFDIIGSDLLLGISIRVKGVDGSIEFKGLIKIQETLYEYPKQKAYSVDYTQAHNKQY